MTKALLAAAFLVATSAAAFAQQAQPEQDAVNALGALDVANKAVRNSVSAYAADVGQKMEASKKSIESMQQTAEAKDKYWAEYAKGTALDEGAMGLRLAEMNSEIETARKEINDLRQRMSAAPVTPDAPK